MITIRRCEQYAEDVLRQVFTQAIEDIGGWEPYIQPGERVLLKVNLVAGRDPDLAATSHPAFVKVLAQMLQEYGCSVVIGDSPGGIFNVSRLKKVYRITGMERAAEESGAELSMDTDMVEVDNPEGKLLGHLTLTSMSRQADKVISVCKLKTHGMMTYTGAVKNLFGTVPGTIKAEYHMRMSEWSDFADALLDIWAATRPVLSFMDAIVGMEGNGPTNGSPRKIGAVLVSPDAAGLDLAGSHLIGLEREQVPLLQQAYLRGWIPESYKQLDLVGDSIEELVVSDYKMPDHIHADLLENRIPKSLQGLSKKLLRPKVHFDHARCVGCGECVANCPAQTITMVEHRPQVNHKNCIRCYCCQELCPKDAVSVRQSVVFKIANRM